MHPLFYNKNKEIVVKLNNIALVEKIKKQISKKVVSKIITYFIENNITTIKLYITQILLNKNIAI